VAQLHSIKDDSSASGESFPLGSTLFPDGANFSLFCQNGILVELLLFDRIDDIEPAKVITLDAKRNKTYHYWHTFLPNIARS
jgi:isoamylase